MNNTEHLLDEHLHNLTEADLKNDLWDFSLKFYRKKGVSDHLLTLQESYQLNINLILFIFWLKDKQLLTNRAFITPLMTIISAMDEQYLYPTRRLRKTIKPWSTASTLYQHSKDLELMLEQHQIAIIFNYYQRHSSCLDHSATITNNDAFIFWQDIDHAISIFSVLNNITYLSGMSDGQE